MCKRPGKWERERAREREKGKGKEDIYYTGTLPAAAQSRKPGIQGGALAIFFCSFLKAKRVLLFRYSACRSAVPKTRNTGRSARHFFFYFLEWKRGSVLCQNVDQHVVDLWSLLGNFGGVFESFWSFLVIFGGPRPRYSIFGG